MRNWKREFDKAPVATAANATLVLAFVGAVLAAVAGGAAWLWGQFSGSVSMVPFATLVWMALFGGAFQIFLMRNSRRLTLGACITAIVIAATSLSIAPLMYSMAKIIPPMVMISDLSIDVSKTQRLLVDVQGSMLDSELQRDERLARLVARAIRDPQQVSEVEAYAESLSRPPAAAAKPEVAKAAAGIAHLGDKYGLFVAFLLAEALCTIALVRGLQSLLLVFAQMMSEDSSVKTPPASAGSAP